MVISDVIGSGFVENIGYNRRKCLEDLSHIGGTMEGEGDFKPIGSGKKHYRPKLTIKYSPILTQVYTNIGIATSNKVV